MAKKKPNKNQVTMLDGKIYISHDGGKRYPLGDWEDAPLLLRNPPPEEFSYTSWIMRRLQFIRELPCNRLFSTDQIWAAASDADRKVPEPRAMGQVMAEAHGMGLIEHTGRYERSTGSKCHGRPVAIWRKI